MFAIELDPLDPTRGEIRIGDFVEGFELRIGPWSAADYCRRWRRALQRLLARDGTTVGLVTRRAESSNRESHRAWILFREGVQVFVQERIFVGGIHPMEFDDEGQLVVREPRQERNDAGDAISQWQTDVASITAFLART